MSDAVPMLQFWDVVMDCLVEFHHLDSAEAYHKAYEMRKRLTESDQAVQSHSANISPHMEIAPTGRIHLSHGPGDMVYPSDIVYHEEPFYLACDLMNHHLELEDYQDKYTSITERRGWSLRL